MPILVIKLKSRAFEVVLYPDTVSYDCYSVLKWIRQHYDYVFIYHDKDEYEEDSEKHKKGELKPPHYHVIVRWSGCPRYASGLSKEMGVEERFFIPIHGNDDSRTCLKYRLRYLIHANELEKYQYPVSDVKGGGKLKDLFIFYIGANNDKTIQEQLKSLCNYIHSSRYISTENILFYALDNGLYKAYKTERSSIFRILDEHNYHYSYKDYD